MKPQPSGVAERSRSMDEEHTVVKLAAVAEAESTERSSRLRKPLLLAAPVAVVLVVLYFYLTGGRYESTDNAYVQAGLVAVTANVDGPVVAVEVHDNQPVKAGDVLFRIDPATFQMAVDEAAARLADIRSQVEARQASYHQGQAELQAARDTLAFAEREAARQQSLLAEGIASQSQYDQAQLAVQTARQQIATSVQKNAGIVATLSGSVAAPIDDQPAVKQARAALERAQLNLGYTVVRAPQDGIVTKVHQLQVGSYVTAAKPVFTLAGQHLWVEANFKENQLRRMRAGQPATFKVDAFPDLHLTGHLASFSPGTGNTFSLLPAENATGNWVKVVQRLPVELSIDQLPDGVALHSGLSVEVTVDTGYRRHLIGSDTAVAARRQ